MELSSANTAFHVSILSPLVMVPLVFCVMLESTGTLVFMVLFVDPVFLLVSGVNMLGR